MRFNVKAILTCSAAIGREAVPVLEMAVEEANTRLFRKGVPVTVDPAEIGHITSWAVEGDRILLSLESGPYTRVHDALFRFRKQLAPLLGKFRIGLRGLEVVSYHILLDEGSSPDLVPRLPFIRGVSEQDGRVKIDLAVTASDLENRLPDRIVRLIEEKAQARQYGGKTEHWELLYQSEARPRLYSGNPTEELIARKWVKHGASRGQWIYAPQAVQLFRTFEQIVEEEIIRPLGFREMIFPKLDTWDVLSRSGHAKGVYPEIYYVCTPKTRDPAYWEDIADYFKVTGEVWVDKIRERIDGPIGAMCYAQCPSFWPFVQGETLASDCLPVRVFDRSGTSHRYESGGIHGIERVDEFHRIEILWLGTCDQTVQMAESLHEAYSHVFNDILELEWRAARVTPWFMAQEGMVGACGCESVGTTDYEAILPYNGNWLEFQNVSVNGDKYPRGFTVKIQSGEECWSGCSGIGLERWTAAFLSQKGFDPAAWPEAVSQKTGELPDIFRFL
jgi:seryl-tRNA synthetase (EC 6.1.1.11)